VLVEAHDASWRGNGRIFRPKVDGRGADNHPVRFGRLADGHPFRLNGRIEMLAGTARWAGAQTAPPARPVLLDGLSPDDVWAVFEIDDGVLRHWDGRSWKACLVRVPDTPTRNRAT